MSESAKATWRMFAALGAPDRLTCRGFPKQQANGLGASSPDMERHRPSSPGKCWIVGSGPGSKEYLTLKAVQLLKEADVVVYDDLATQDIQEYCQKATEIVYVGKRGGKASTSQLAINQLLVERCQQGQNVVRLKGGCPSTFSRVWNEIQALKHAGASWEMIPGVSSALAAPVLAGWPLTDTHLSKSYAVLSGHNVAQYDWDGLKAVDTLVVLMGSRTLDQLKDVLQKHGWSPETRISVIHSAAREDQQVLYGCLCDIVDKTEGRDLSPCIIIVGGAAELPTLEDQPLRFTIHQSLPS